jgi:outer membrane protein assembly factor BamB
MISASPAHVKIEGGKEKMVSLGSSMRKWSAFLLISLGFSCSLFRVKIPPYPQGVLFPLEEAARVSYEGKIVKAVLDRGQNLYFSTDGGLLYCIEGVTRKVIWTYAAPSPLGCPPAVTTESVLVWDETNNLYCLDLAGGLRWEKQIKEEIVSGIAWDRDEVYVGTQEGTFMAVRQSSGEALWQLRTEGAFQAEAVFWGGQVIIGCADGKLYFINQRKDLGAIVEIGSPVHVTPLVAGDRLYLGSEDSFFQCLDLKTRKRKWRVRLGGKLVVSPRADAERVFFVASNSVLYCLDKKGGDILWWWIAPSRSAYDLELSDGKVLVTAFSSVLYCLDARTGKEVGRYDAKSEIKSNPLWYPPYALINLYDYLDDKGAVVFLAREIRVKLAPSMSPPQPEVTEVTLTATATGFYLPKYEFFLQSGEERTVVQKESERNSWVWFPEKEGNYTVGVRVRDGKNTREAEIPFKITSKTKQAHQPESKARSG